MNVDLFKEKFSIIKNSKVKNLFFYIIIEEKMIIVKFKLFFNL